MAASVGKVALVSLSMTLTGTHSMVEWSTINKCDEEICVLYLCVVLFVFAYVFFLGSLCFCQML